jgi:hypothetical protein
VAACGLALAVVVAVAALVAGLFLRWAPGFYLPVTLALGVPVAALVAVGAACGGPSLSAWLLLELWGVAALAAGPAEAMFVVLWGVAGLVLAAAVRGQWWYGRTVAALAAPLLAGSGLHALAHRDEFGQVARGFFSWLVVTAQQYARAETDAEAKQKFNVLSESWRSLQLYWPSIGFGLFVVLIVLAAVVLAALTAAGLRHMLGRTAFRGSFREMRPPDSLVWLGILLAALAFVDWRWQVPALRHISWNAGIGLSVVYFLNGLSVMIYVLGVVGPPVLAPLALVLVFLTSAQAYPALFAVGLFDTWAEFRARLNRWVIRMRERAEEDEDG